MDGWQGEFAVADAVRQTFGKPGDRLFAIGRHEFLEGGEQGGIGHAISIHAVQDRFLPGLQEIGERGPPRIFGCVAVQWLKVAVHHRSAFGAATMQKGDPITPNSAAATP